MSDSPPPRFDFHLTKLLALLHPHDPRLLYVFGSIAQGRERPDSDVDLALLTGGINAPGTLFDVAHQMTKILRKDVDLVDLAAASTILRAEVIGKGTLLFAASARDQQEFEMRALSDYARLNEERAPVLAQIERDGTIYGH